MIGSYESGQLRPPILERHPTALSVAYVVAFLALGFAAGCSII